MTTKTKTSTITGVQEHLKVKETGSGEEPENGKRSDELISQNAVIGDATLAAMAPTRRPNKPRRTPQVELPTRAAVAHPMNVRNKLGHLHILLMPCTHNRMSDATNRR